MNFIDFQKVVTDQFDRIKDKHLYRVDLSKDQLWDTYLSAFPEGTNPMFRERTVHDCQCCKQFIRQMGGVVAYVNGERFSVWTEGVDSDDPIISAVSTAMDNLCTDSNTPIREPFFHYEKQVGTAHNRSGVDPNEEWDHFALVLPAIHIKKADEIATIISKMNSSKAVFTRALEDISMDSIETVIELIEQGSLYRGEENMHVLNKFHALKTAYNGLSGCIGMEEWLWKTSRRAEQAIVRIRNTSIGTLLIDLTEGKTLDAAVGAFEAMVAPSNYKRPTALITKTMIANAEATCTELGFTEALQRRHAQLEDIKVTNVLYVSRTTIKKLSGGNPFAELAEEATVDIKKLSKVEEVDVATFVADILPKTEKLEILMENHHENNLMSLVAPADPEAANMLKWGNNFSWTYNGEITDSMKQRVKAAGGNVEGVIRFSIQWNEDDTHNNCDYDAHCIEPGGNLIYYGVKHNNRTSGNLDVDITHTSRGKPAVENITWSQESKMEQGRYKFLVHNFALRSGNNGFTAELEHDGNIRSYAYNKPLRQGEKVDVVTADFNKGVLDIVSELPATTSSKEVWGMKTMRFSEVAVLMNSPNHWDGEETGNKHMFFIVQDCKQPGDIRGFYNEFLTDKLHEHRKVFEVLGSKMRVAESDSQLSGLGFSNTQRNHVYAKVTGGFTRTIKITF